MNAGVVTAYGAAKAGGYTGTYEQFCALMASIATIAFVQTEVGNLETSINTELENLRTRVEGSVLVIGSAEGE